MSEISKEYFNNGHIQPIAFLMLEIGGLSDQERELILTHLQECDECMQAYVDSLTDDSLIDPPQSLESNILRAVETEKIKKKENKLLAIQFVKLGVAVCLTMVLMFGGVFDFVENIGSYENRKPTNNTEPKVNIFANVSEIFNEKFNEFASSVNNTTFFKDDEKKQNDADKDKPSKNNNL